MKSRNRLHWQPSSKHGGHPRVPVGAKMAITIDGEVAGSVSGGCVENAVIEAALTSLQTDQPRLLHFGVADETAWEVGLACGGSIDVFVKPLDPEFFKSLLPILKEGAAGSGPYGDTRAARDPGRRDAVARGRRSGKLHCQ